MEDNVFNCESYPKTRNMFRWKSGKRVDSRLLGLLESFEEIYADRREFFKKIFSGDHEELFEKIGDALKRKKQMKKAKSMSRSMSMRSKRGLDGEVDEIRIERFKIRTPNVIVGGSDGTTTQPGT